MSRTPLAIYVLWHPDSRDGAPLAQTIYTWFHASSRELLRAGLGLPVYFRSDPWRIGEGDSTPRPIDINGADVNIVVLLADENMVSDPQWVKYADDLAKDDLDVQVYPVALHESAYRLPESMRRINFLRVDARSDPEDQGEQTRFDRRRTRLIRQLTEVLGRLLTDNLLAEQEDTESGAPPPLTLFLSHAKKDGTEVAEAVRSSIQSHGQVRAFYDDSDLPIGHAFASELERALEKGSAATIAIVTDAYAGRPWCRREVMLARTPRQDTHYPNCWSIQPVLVIDCLEKSLTRGVPELGNAPVVRWQPNQAFEVIDFLALEVLVSVYHRLRATRIKAKPRRQIINWTPDLPTVLALQHEVDGNMDEIVYPGHGLPNADRKTFGSYFPNITFTTFEEAEAGDFTASRPLANRLVGVSVGFSADTGRLGLGSEHIEEAAVRISRCLIDLGAGLAFGGMLASSGLVETLLTLVRSQQPEEDSDEKGLLIKGSRLLSYQRWPATPTRVEIAKNVGISDFVFVRCPLPEDELVDNDPRLKSPRLSRQHAYALSAMRRSMTNGGDLTSAGDPAPPLCARVILGGSRSGFNGFIPGIFEEALYAFEARQPVYLLGGFGGGAGVLANAILELTSPPELTVAFHRDISERFRQLERGLAANNESQIIEQLFDRMRKEIVRIRLDVAAGFDNGLDADENRQLMQSESLAEVIGLLYRGITRCFQSQN